MVAPMRAAILVGIVTVVTAFGAAARAPTPDDVLTLRELGDYRGGLAVSPDGEWIAVIERQADLAADRYRNRLLIIATAGGRPRALADVGDVLIRWTLQGFTGAFTDRVPQWSPDSRSLAYLAMHDGRIELWRTRLDGLAPDRIAGEDADVLRYRWLDDDRLVIELAETREALHERMSRALRSGFHPDDAYTPYASLRPARTSGVGVTHLVLDLRDGRTRPAHEAERERLQDQPSAPIGAGAIARDQNAAGSTWISPITPGDPATTPRLGLYRADGDGSNLRRCGASACTGRMLGAWTIGSEILLRRMEGHGDGLTAIYAWDWSSDRVRLVRRADEELFGCDDAGARLICLQESPLQPRQIVSIDPATGEATTLYEPNPQWSDLDLTRVELIEAADIYGNETFAHLVFPTNYVRGRRYPVVIVQYRSRGFLRGGVGGEYPIHALAGRGYFVLNVDRPEWRGVEAQTPYRELFLRTELDGSENTMKQSGLEAMLAELDRRGLSDPRRIGVTGLSDGAETVYWGITRSNLFAAAVVSTPPTDPTAWTLGSAAYRRMMLDEGLQGPWAGASGPWANWWATNTTVLHAEAITAPLLMNLPESEALMGFPLAARLSELDRAIDVYVYPDAYHVKWRPQQLRSAQHRSLDWLDFWLLDIEREDPEEPGRLERWRALRDASSRR